MRKAVLALSLTTGLFAASTLYLAYRLYDEESATTGHTLDVAQHRESDPASVSNVGEFDPGPRAQAGAAATVPASSPASTKGAPGQALPSTVTREDHERELIKEHAKQWLAKYDDPTQHSTLLDESRTRLRRQYEQFRARYGLDAVTFDQFLTVIAEQEMAPQERYFRCVVDPACDPKETARRAAPLEDRSAELDALLGKYAEEFTRYRDTIGERESVAQLRGRLSESNALRDDQAEGLVLALNEERNRYSTEVTQRGETLNGWGTPLGMLWFSGDSNSVEQRLADAAAYNRRMRDRAATVLTPQQLAVFTQIQDELLAAMRASMRSPG